jgi:hypothetical protein
MVPLGILNVGGDVALTVLGAVSVAAMTAWVTARTTSSRLDKQLAAERQRTDLQVEAENTRHEAQRSHDRALNDLAELRSLLDETSQLISRCVKTSSQIATNWRARDQPESLERLEAQRQFLRNEIVEIVECHQRVMLRLPRDSGVSECLDDVRVRVGRLLKLSRGDLSEDDALAMEKGEPSLEIAEAHVRFLDAARVLVGSRPPLLDSGGSETRL